MTASDLHTLIERGENEKVEFKSSFNIETIKTLVALANTRGGQVLIGVSDNAEITGINLSNESIQNWVNEIKNKTLPFIIPEVETYHIGSKKIVLFSIQEYPIKPISVRGKYYKRVANSNHLMSTSEVVNLHLQTFNTSWDYHLNNNFSIEEISFTKVQRAIDAMKKRGTAILEGPLSFLLKNDLVRGNAISNAAYLLFKKKESVLTTIEMGRFQTDTIIKDTTRTKSDILAQVDQVLEFVKKHINREVIITGDPKNNQKWQYPMEAMREIVLNMIVHRDYRSSSDSIVKIYNHKSNFTILADYLKTLQFKTFGTININPPPGTN